jgi:hypothetical protein
MFVPLLHDLSNFFFNFDSFIVLKNFLRKPTPLVGEICLSVVGELPMQDTEGSEELWEAILGLLLKSPIELHTTNVLTMLDFIKIIVAHLETTTY